MIKFLKILATPFVALWRWIKETAWVQPLLIVGCIFAVIFSIPYISQGIQNLNNKSEDSLAYYKSHLLSMNGAYKGESSNKAEMFLSKISELQTSWYSIIEEKATEEDTKFVDDFKQEYGEKFFFVIGKSECDACSNISEALEYLEQNQPTYDISNYKMYSIIADEELTDDPKEYQDESAFQMINGRQTSAFETLYTSGYYGFYSENIETASERTSFVTKLDTLHEDASKMEVPLVCMFDLTEDALKDKNPYAISQLFYTLEGEDKFDKALQLANCWLYRGDVFSKQ